MSESLLKQKDLHQEIEQHQTEHVHADSLTQEVPQVQTEQVQQVSVIDTMKTKTDVKNPAEPIPENATQQAASTSKKPCFSHKHRHEPKTNPPQEKKKIKPEVAALRERMHDFQAIWVDFYTEDFLANRIRDMDKKLKNLDEKKALRGIPKELKGEARTIRKLEIQKDFQEQRLRLIEKGTYDMPVGTKRRKEMTKMREKAGLRLDRIKRELKAYSYSVPAQKKREIATLKRHDRFDFHKKTFRRDNPLSHQDAEHISPDGSKLLVNQGRAYFGGTKPMYIFKDMADKKDYLYKEAVNCIGIYKPEGALVTEAAAALQKKLRGDYAIPAWAIRDDNGKVLGSMQEKLEQKQEGRVDLFDWQIYPEKFKLSEQIKSEVLKEHTLDWLLCNFDTKGENFLHRTDGHLSSFDKEASFSFLKDKKSRHMSATYQPHSNQTIYNVFFQRFADGDMDLDLNAVKEPMEIALSMTKEEYANLFAEMLDHKYGQGTKKRQQMEDAILERRDNLKEEYETFFTKLLNKRKSKAKGDWRDDPACKQLIKQADGSFQFHF